MTQNLFDRSEHSAAFPKLSAAQVDSIKSCAECRSVAAGETLIQAGEKNIPFYVLEAGKLEVVDESSGDRRTMGQRTRHFTVAPILVLVSQRLWQCQTF